MQKWTLTLLEVGLFAFHLSAFALVLIHMDGWAIALTSSFVIAVSALGTWYIIQRKL